MSLRLRIRAGNPPEPASSIERVVEIAPNTSEVVIGRRRGVDIELPFAVVSEQHARLSHRGQRWVILDLGSANGTLVNGRRLTPYVAHDLSEGDVLRLANIEMLLLKAQPTQNLSKEDQPESTITLARRLVNDLFGANKPGEVARLVVIGGPGDGRELRLETINRRYRVGRGARSHFVVTDDDMSREHAEIERRWDGVFARDLRSKNGTLILGTRLVGEKRLSDGDVLLMGQTSFRLEDPEDRYLRQMAESEPMRLGVGESEQDILDTRTSSGPRPCIPMAASGQGADASSKCFGYNQKSSHCGPWVLVVISALVLVGSVGLALSFLIGN